MKKQISLKDTVMIVLVTLIGIVCSVVFNFLLFFGFLPGFIFLYYVCIRKGYTYTEIGKSALVGLLKTKEVILILLLVGLLLPSWQIAGTITGMVEVILSFINPSFFYVSAFISTLVVSMILGTSVGTLSAIGIPIIAAAVSIGMSVEIAAGALVSGAFVGDRTSPFSSANQLLSNTLEIERKPFQRILWKTGFVACVASILFFFIQDILIDSQPLSSVKTELEANVIVMFPLLVLILLALLKIKIRTCFIVSIAVALVIIYSYQRIPLEFQFLWNGTQESGGGLRKMIPLVAFIGLAGAYNGIIEKFQVFQLLLTKWLGTKTSLYTMTWKTMVATLFISLLACNQTLPIILTGRTFLPDWTKNHQREQLARVMADSSMLFAGMIPWSVLAIMCSTVLGVSLFTYLPFAILLWCLPILTLSYSFWLRKEAVKSNVRESVSK
ncbi:Na+/H+ antiporter NhaC family protein [Bacillus sp. DJP31]|uniref:Na+/H+ antiporter NhaC family protein n=1 Tax=Bacillus sp. DJP31 TaxID=3409789 RepID=UPI003BB5B5D2